MHGREASAVAAAGGSEILWVLRDHGLEVVRRNWVLETFVEALPSAVRIREPTSSPGRVVEGPLLPCSTRWWVMLRSAEMVAAWWVMVAGWLVSYPHSHRRSPRAAGTWVSFVEMHFGR